MKLEEIYAWQKAKELAVEIYKLDFDNSDFQKNIRISAQKISIHIAKGFERVTNSDFLDTFISHKNIVQRLKL